jgi:hypothetical protein
MKHTFDVRIASAVNDLEKKLTTQPVTCLHCRKRVTDTNENTCTKEVRRTQDDRGTLQLS